MKSFLINTYFNLMRSIALALTLEEKPRLYVITDYSNIDDGFLERVEETEIFSSVARIDYQEFLPEFSADLRKTASMTEEEIDEVGDRIFERHLTPFFQKIFRDADKKDDIYIFNDFLWPFYYIEKNFDNIIAVEDGYRVLRDFLYRGLYVGDMALVQPFVDKYHPPHYFMSEKIRKIITSCDFPEMDRVYRDRFVVLDHFDVLNRNRNAYLKAIFHIFQVEDLTVLPGSTLFLTQPLYRSGFSTAAIHYLMNRKIIRSALARGPVYIKPHPAEQFDFNLLGGKGVMVLPQKVPSEIFNDLDVSFERGITFSSTALFSQDYVKKAEKIQPDGELTRDEVRALIQNYTEGERVQIDFYVKVTELTPQNYMSVWSFFFPGNVDWADVRVVAVTPAALAEQARSYLAATNFHSARSAFVAQMTNRKERLVFGRSLALVKNRRKILREKRVEVVGLEDLRDQRILEECAFNRSTPDYLMIVEEGNLGFSLLRELMARMRYRMSYVYFPDQYAGAGAARTPLLPCLRKEGVYGQLSHILLHGSILEMLGGRPVDTLSLSRILREYRDRDFFSVESGQLSATLRRPMRSAAEGFSAQAERTRCVAEIRDLRKTLGDGPRAEELWIEMTVNIGLDFVNRCRNARCNLPEDFFFSICEQAELPDSIAKKAAAVLQKRTLERLDFEYSRYVYREREPLEIFRRGNDFLLGTGLIRLLIRVASLSDRLRQKFRQSVPLKARIRLRRLIK